jgi:hypothetical protein
MKRIGTEISIIVSSPLAAGGTGYFWKITVRAWKYCSTGGLVLNRAYPNLGRKLKVLINFV